MSVLRRLATQTAIYGLSSILGRVLNFALTPFYTEKFDPDAFGVISSLYAAITFINVFLTFGMETTYFRFIQTSGEPRRVYDQAFSWVGLMGSISFLVLSIAGTAIAQKMGYDIPAHIPGMIAGIVFLDALSALPLAKLRQEDKAARFAMINLVNIIVTLGLNIFFILRGGAKIEYIFLANLIASALRFLMALWNNLPSSFTLHTSLLSSMLGYGVFIMVAGLTGFVNETLDRILLPWLWTDGKLWNGIPRTGNEMNGIYAATYKIAMLITLFTQAYRYAVEPFFFKEATKTDSPVTFAKIFHYFTMVTLLGFLLLSVFGYELISFPIPIGGGSHFTLIDDRYWEGLQVNAILLMANIFFAAYLNLSIWFKLTNRTSYALWFTGGGALLTIVINVIGIPRWGFVASAWATLTCYAFMAVSAYLVGKKYYPVPYRMVRLLVYALLAVIAYLIGTLNGFDSSLAKLGIVAIAIVIVWVWEKMFPIRWGSGKATKKADPLADNG